MLKNDLADNLNALMANARVSSSELAKEIGIPATTIKRIRNKEHSNPTLTTLLPIARYFSISLNELIGSDALNFSTVSDAGTKSYQLPVLTWKDCSNYETLNYNLISEKIFTERTVSTKAFALVIEDNSLESLPEGCTLIIEPEKKPENGNYVVVCNTEQKIASIRKYIIEIDQIYLKPLVSGIGASILTTNYKILGVIIQYKKNLAS